MMKKNRRDFIQSSLLITGGVILNSKELLAKNEGTVEITILHTNDTHSRIDPFPASDPKYAGMGGVAKRMHLINKIRNKEKNVLLFDSGDIFQGTPYFNLYGGELELKLMSKMGYDAATMGNHDFDNGLEGFKKVFPFASFPFICSNYVFKGTTLEGLTYSYKVFTKQGLRIGVFGIGIELFGLVDDKNYKGTQYINGLDVANRTAKYLKQEEKCDLIICLSHVGYAYENKNKISDEVLAQQSKNIHLILGGHTHTFLDDSVIFKNLDNEEVHVAQTGFGGIRLGKVNIKFEKKTKKISMFRGQVKIS